MKLRCLAAGMAAVVLAAPGLTHAAAPDQLSPQAKAWGVMTAKTAFNAARNCFEHTKLALVTHQSKTMGVEKQAILQRTEQQGFLNPATRAAIDLGYEIPHTADPRLEAAYHACLNTNEQEVIGTISK